VGPWTAHYLAMRALHLPDAFPSADLGIKKALSASPREAEAREHPITKHVLQTFGAQIKEIKTDV